MNDDKVKLVKRDLCEADLALFNDQEVLAVDCEMMGLNVTRDRLCLVQIGDKDHNVRLVQIMQGQEAAPNLKLLLENKHIVLFHYARSDLAWLKRWLGIRVNNYFCTKVASKLARTYTDKHGLKDLCKEVIGKDISKSQQSSYWGAAELTRNQLNYAANDVYFLIEIYQKLKMMLIRENKYELALKCISFIETFADLDSLGYQEVLEH
jgi:ribonuclease D